MKLTEAQAATCRRLVDWLKDRTECTRAEAAAAVGMVDDRDFKMRVWWPAVQVLHQCGIAYRSCGGGGRYAVTDWRGMWHMANGTLRTARKKFGRAQQRLPPESMVPEEKRAALARARDRLGHADMVLATREEAARQLVTVSDYAGELGCATTTPR